MSVYSVIVTCQPDLPQLERTLLSLRPQVDDLLIVDNASQESLRDGLRRLASAHNAQLIENPENLGIATALNIGVEHAMLRQAAFVLFFDQDSIPSADFVAQEVACYRRHSQSHRVGIVAPQIVNRVSGARSGPVESRGKLLLAQTSGALMPIVVFQYAGLFFDDLFIDYVDYEYCLRMGREGWGIAFADRAELDHMPGGNQPVSRFGYRTFAVGAAPLRHYYEVRNCLWLSVHYLHAYPVMSARLVWRLLRERIKVLFFETNRAAKMRAWAQGFADALRNRLGPRTL